MIVHGDCLGVLAEQEENRRERRGQECPHALAAGGGLDELAQSAWLRSTHVLAAFS